MKPSSILFHVFSMALTGVAGILWPMWVMDGTFDGELYPAIGSFIAIYGGFIANIVYIYKQKKNK